MANQSASGSPSGPGPLIWVVILLAAGAGAIWGIGSAIAVGVAATALFVLIGLALQQLERRNRAERMPPLTVMTGDAALTIVRDYGAVLESAAPPPGGVADVAALPYSKTLIRDALMFLLRSTTDNKQREQLKVGLLYLADWQPGVGAKAVGPGDFLGNDPNESTMDTVKRIATMGNPMEKWRPLVEAEQAALKAELEVLGLW